MHEINASPVQRPSLCHCPHKRGFTEKTISVLLHICCSELGMLLLDQLSKEAIILLETTQTSRVPPCFVSVLCTSDHQNIPHVLRTVM